MYLAITAMRLNDIIFGGMLFLTSMLGLEAGEAAWRLLHCRDWDGSQQTCYTSNFSITCFELLEDVRYSNLLQLK